MLANALGNSGWLAADRVVRLLVGFAVGIGVARHLQPAGFGELNHAIAFVSLFSIVAGMGLEGLLVRDLVRRPERAPMVLGTAAGLRLVGGIAALGLCLAGARVLRPDDATLGMLVLVLSLAPFFQVTDVVDAWFQSRGSVRPQVVARLAAFLAAAALRLALIASGASVRWFAWALAAEAALTAAALAWSCARSGGFMPRWSFNRTVARHLLAQSWPAAVTSFSVIVYTRIDQVMLGEMTDPGQVGIYSVAVRLTEMWNAIPIMFSIALFPAIVRLRDGDAAVFESRLLALFCAMIWSAILLSALTSVVASIMVPTLFGSTYTAASGPLTVLAWVLVFVFPSTVRSRWFVAEGFLVHGMAVGLAVCTINVSLNLILIPELGPTGAAVASVAAYPLGNLVVAPFSAPVRRSLRLFGSALLLPAKMLHGMATGRRP